MRLGAITLVWLGGLAAFGSGRAAVTETTVTLVPVADAEVHGGNANTNFGTSTTATVWPESFVPAPAYVYLRFDLSVIPAGAQVQEATLTVQAFNGFAYGGDGTVYVHFVPADAWSETGITWNTRPAQSATVLGSWWLWYDSTPADQLGTTTTTDLAAAVQTEAQNDDLLSLMLRSPGYRTDYRTREYGTVAQRPKLTVRYRTILEGVGRVPDGSTGSPLRLTRLDQAGSSIQLSWGPSCGAAATDYAVYEGTLGAWYSHVPITCSTSGQLEAVVASLPLDGAYYLVVPLSTALEGSYGTNSAGIEIPPGTSPCLSVQDLPSCP